MNQQLAGCKENSMADYTSLKKLVGSDFTVQQVHGYSWKMWDNVAKTMLSSDTYQPQHRKMYDVDTDKGKMDISSNQFGSMLEGVSKNGKADVVGWRFHVKSNGKTGMEIRYFINPVANDGIQAYEDKMRETAEEVAGEITTEDFPF